MTPAFDHERALLLVLREGDPPAAGFEALLAHPDVAMHHLPAPWAFEAAGVDLGQALPDLGTISRERLGAVLDVLVRLHTSERLDALCRRLWREADEQVRSFFLARPALTTLAAIVRLAPRTADLPPPREFVQGQVYVHRFEMQYRLRGAASRAGRPAPPEEGSLVLYPFDPPNGAARREVGLDEGRAPVLEAFAYGTGRARHRDVLDQVARRHGWRVFDTLPPR